MHLKTGVYDEVLLANMGAAIDALADAGYEAEIEPISQNDVAFTLAEAARQQLVRILETLLVESEEPADKRLVQVASLINDVLQSIAKFSKIDSITVPPRKLLAVKQNGENMVRPETGLSTPWLFTAGKGQPSLYEELRKEIASSNSVDVLISFITVSGVRKIIDILTSKTAATGCGNSNFRFRVLTTTYTGATEQAAVDQLARLPGCEVKISMDGRRTRLHAKAWLFKRETGFGSAYVGSANLSAAALLGGLEWTVKFTERGQQALYNRAQAHFETLWDDPEFEAYDPADEKSVALLRRALTQARGQNTDSNDLNVLPFFSLSPKTYQLEMLEDLALERARGRFRNLVVAATGTGKTMVAAFDYARSCEALGGRPRLLFVAHRAQILVQAMYTYREVLHDRAFGELLGDGALPEQWDHVFATIQSITSKGIIALKGASFWHTVVVDECHRIVADTFHAFVSLVKPKILLGLTATPERSDGNSIMPYFDNRPDGSPAVELRLWTALDLQLLAPFEYYGCDDETDFSEVPWDRAGETAALEGLLITDNTRRARLIVDEWQRLSGNAHVSRALVFCVSVAHAEYMTKYFNNVGLPSVCVVGSTSKADREAAPRKLQQGTICAIVTCDMYNEGIDIPEVNVILLLRPTQSPVLFQQQIGRGLRLVQGKDACLVLDFVGRFRTDFRIDTLYRAITGLSRAGLVEALEHGFTKLPPGCHIHLDKQPRDRILNAIKSFSTFSWKNLTAELHHLWVTGERKEISLTEFLNATRVEIGDLYRSQGPSGWAAIKRAAGVPTAPQGPEDEYFGKNLRFLLHVDDPQRARAIIDVAEHEPEYAVSSETNHVLEQMVAYQIDGNNTKVGSGNDFIRRIHACPAIRVEVSELGAYLLDMASVSERAVPMTENAPLILHAGYSRREILTAFKVWNATSRPSNREGVVTLKGSKIEIFFVTLDKSEGFSASTSYEDYAISPNRFHWQSKNAVGPDTMSGRRYIESKTNGWVFQLFVRTDKTAPFRACGPVTLESWEGDRPMSLIWHLSEPLSPRLFAEFSVLRDA